MFSSCFYISSLYFPFSFSFCSLRFFYYAMVSLFLFCESVGHLMQKTDSFKKTLMLGKIEGGRRRGWQRMRWLDGIINLMDMSLSKLKQESWCASCLWGHKELDTTEWLNWTVCFLFFVTLFFKYVKALPYLFALDW